MARASPVDDTLTLNYVITICGGQPLDLQNLKSRSQNVGQDWSPRDPNAVCEVAKFRPKSDNVFLFVIGAFRNKRFRE